MSKPGRNELFVSIGHNEVHYAGACHRAAEHEWRDGTA